MIERLLEAFFRHAVLILLPIVVIPLDVAAAMLSTPPQYEAQAGMWVEQATYLSYSTDDINRYLPPAMNQKNRLAELMQTRSFLSEVANDTPLAPIIGDANGDDALRQLFARDFEAAATGDHLLTLRFRAEDRDDAVVVLDKMVAAFKARAAADRYGQAQVAITFYKSRVTDAEAELAAARNGLAKYLAENPAVAAALAVAASDPARFDPKYAEVQRGVDTAQKDADAARSSLERAELDVAAGVQGLELGFRIVDPVLASATPSRQLRKVLIYPIAALLLGLILGASLLLLFALSDRSVRSLADLGPDVVILGVLPHLRPRGVARRPGAAVTRRAVGFLAGAVVPLRASRERKAS
jgi:capsular polysaccharide biosynthesis protein